MGKTCAMGESRGFPLARSIKPFPDEMMVAWNFEISPTLLRDFLGHRLLIREQTSWGKYSCSELRQLFVSKDTSLTEGDWADMTLSVE